MKIIKSYESFNPEEHWENEPIEIEPYQKYFVYKENWSDFAKLLIENGYVWLGRNKIKTDKIDDLENNWERTKEIIIYTDGGDSGGMIGTTYKSITYDTDYTYKKNDFGDWEKEKEGAIKF